MLHLTPEMLVLSYALLRETTPFKSWKLPHPDYVGFQVSRTLDVCGQFWIDPRKQVPCIAISGAAVSRLDTLVRIMAHEMIHLKQWASKEITKGIHNARFRRRAATVCRAHGFDPKLFV